MGSRKGKKNHFGCQHCGYGSKKKCSTIAKSTIENRKQEKVYLPCQYCGYASKNVRYKPSKFKTTTADVKPGRKDRPLSKNVSYKPSKSKTTTIFSCTSCSYSSKDLIRIESHGESLHRDKDGFSKLNTSLEEGMFDVSVNVVKEKFFKCKQCSYATKCNAYLLDHIHQEHAPEILFEASSYEELEYDQNSDYEQQTQITQKVEEKQIIRNTKPKRNVLQAKKIGNNKGNARPAKNNMKGKYKERIYNANKRYTGWERSKHSYEKDNGTSQISYKETNTEIKRQIYYANRKINNVNTKNKILNNRCINEEIPGIKQEDSATLTNTTMWFCNECGFKTEKEDIYRKHHDWQHGDTLTDDLLSQTPETPSDEHPKLIDDSHLKPSSGSTDSHTKCQMISASSKNLGETGVESRPQKPHRTTQQQLMLTIFRCNKCNAVFSSRHYLKIHRINVHGVKIKRSTRMKLYQCVMCKTSFSATSMLTDHVKQCRMRIQISLTRSMECSGCKRMFGKDCVTVHTLHEYVENGPDLFACEDCGHITPVEQ